MLAIVCIITRYLLRIVRLIFENIELGTIQIQGFEPDWIWPTHRIAKTIVIIFAVIVAYPYIPGSGTAAFKGITIFLGVILSLRIKLGYIEPALRALRHLSAQHQRR